MNIVTCYYDSNEERIQYSATFKKFIQSTITGCTLRTILNPVSSIATNTFFSLNQYYSVSNIPPANYIVEKFKKLKYIHFSESAFALKVQRHDSPLWHMKRHSNCHGFLFIVESERNFWRTFSTYISQLNSRKENPLYILIWDVRSPPKTISEWREVFNSHSFYSSFADYRLHVGVDGEGRQYDIKLICKPCSSFHYGLKNSKFFVPIDASPTPENIHTLWQRYHQNHHGLAFNCWSCENSRDTPLQDVIFLADMITVKFNLTLISRFVQLPYLQFESKIYGFVTHAFPMTPETIEKLFLRNVYPSFTIVSSALDLQSFHMTTVTRRSVFVSKRWTAIFSPVSMGAWIGISTVFVALVLLLRNIYQETSLGNLVLALWAPLTDHFNSPNFESCAGFIVHAWTILCMSNTVLYGGDMVSALNAFTTPSYHKTLEEFGDENVNLYSITPTRIRDQEVCRVSSTIQWALSRTGHRPNDKQRFLKYQSIAGKLNQTYCYWYYIHLNMSNAMSLLTCKNENRPLKFDKFVTFIESQDKNDAIKLAYQRSPLFWVSPTSNLNLWSTYTPVMLRKNYFSKLVFSMLGWWWQAGFENRKKFWKRLRFRRRYCKNETISALVSYRHATNVNDFVPMNTDLFKTMSPVFVVLILGNVGVFVIEYLGPILEHTNLQTILSGFVEFYTLIISSPRKLWRNVKFFVAMIHARIRLINCGH